MAQGACLLATVSPAWAQLSPGELAQPHAALEGGAGCPRCHEPGKGVSRERCLECHTALQARIADARGLHARPEYAACETCHIEHHGRDVALVWWGEAGRESFDHDQTGYALEGRHAGLACERCHAPERIREPQQLSAGAASPERSFLGLDTACLACHADVHRAQLPSDCSACHNLDAWRPAAGFDHARSRYPLAGAHGNVACERCHAAARDAEGAYVRYRGLAFSACTDCHRDPHAGRLGTECERCHEVSAWTPFRGARFDHDRTAYPLRARHAAVRCEACHRGRQTGRLPHAACTDCHADSHRGELSQRADGGRCDTCHDVRGFSPARYAIDDHAASAYPLAGAHRAVPCDRCHRAEPGTPVATLRPRSAACTDCHADPHGGDTLAASGAQGCASCHVVDSWRRVAFDHAAVRYPLEGQHADVTCVACHPVAAGQPAGRLAFTGRPKACSGCHADPHAGQLARGSETACERCHDVVGWRPVVRFDHARDTTWALDGAHARVPCAACHPTEARGDARVVRYKPVSHLCNDCHAGGVP